MSFQYFLTDIKDWMRRINLSDDEILKEMINKHPDTATDVLNSFFHNLHQDTFYRLPSYVRKTMSKENHDFSEENLYKVIVDLETQLLPKRYEYLGIEPESCLRYFAKTSSKWYTENFIFPEDTN